MRNIFSKRTKNTSSKKTRNYSKKTRNYIKKTRNTYSKRMRTAYRGWGIFSRSKREVLRRYEEIHSLRKQENESGSRNKNREVYGWSRCNTSARSTSQQQVHLACFNSKPYQVKWKSMEQHNATISIRMKVLRAFPLLKEIP